MLKALKRLEAKLPKNLTLIVGGGGALVLSNLFPLATSDIDAIPKGMTTEEVGDLVKEVSIELQLPGDWLNPWFASFTHVLPQDFANRLHTVYQGSRLLVQTLGLEDLLIMKCYAHRTKDVPHARALIRKGADTSFVSQHIENLKTKKIPQSIEALDFLDEILDLEDGG